MIKNFNVKRGDQFSFNNISVCNKNLMKGVIWLITNKFQA